LPRSINDFTVTGSNQVYVKKQGKFTEVNLSGNKKPYLRTGMIIDEPKDLSNKHFKQPIYTSNGTDRHGYPEINQVEFELNDKQKVRVTKDRMLQVTQEGETSILDTIETPFIEEIRMMDNERFLLIPEREEGLSSFDSESQTRSKLAEELCYEVTISFDRRLMVCLGDKCLRLFDMSTVQEIGNIELTERAKYLRMTENHIFIKYFEDGDEWSILSLKETVFSKMRMEMALKGITEEEWNEK
jgi:hypothetical protein